MTLMRLKRNERRQANKLLKKIKSNITQLTINKSRKEYWKINN